MLPFLNVFFLVFHTAWMLFNCVGWVWRRTRRWHLLTTVLTAGSWFLLGWYYGLVGYCICTDWHWQVRQKLGYPYDYSYTHLLFLELTGIDVPGRISDIVTGGVFAVTTLLTVILNIRDVYRERRRIQGTVR